MGSEKSEFSQNIIKDKRLSIQIDKSASDIIAFTLNPKNTPLWVESLVKGRNE